MRHHYGITRMQVSSYYLRLIPSILLLVAGGTLWFAPKMRQSAADRKRAEEIFQAADESAALRDLTREPAGVRAAYLRQSLDNPERADPHSLTVALTRIDRKEADFLYSEVIQPAIRPGADAQTVLLAFSLIDRWSAAVDAPALIDAVVVDLGSQDTKRLAAAAFGIATVAAQSPPANAASVAVQIAQSMQREIDPGRLTLLGKAFREVAPKLSPEGAGNVATSLVQRMLVEENWFALRPLDEALAILPDFDGQALANRLLDQAQSRSELAGVDSLVRAARALHDTPAIRQRAASILGGRAHAGLAVESLAGIAVGMGDLSEEPGQLTLVANLIVDRIQETRDPYALALLASGLIAVGPGAPIAAAAPLASRVGERVLRETDPAALVRLALALHGVSHGWTDAQAQGFARQILAEMMLPRGAGRLRLYAVALHAVADRADESVLNRARQIVRERSSGEARRMSLLALGENQELEAEESDAEAAAPLDPLLLFDPTLPEGEWTRLALDFLGAAREEDDDPSIESLAGVEDDDGAEEEEEDAPQVDFNVLSSALDRIRPAGAAEQSNGPALRIVSALLLVAGVALTARFLGKKPA